MIMPFRPIRRTAGLRAFALFFPSISLLLFFASFSSLRSQEPDFIWRPFGQGICGGTVLAFGFADDGSVLAGTTAGLYLLPAGERQWQKTIVTSEITHIARTANGAMLAGTIDGSYRSTDNGRTWSLMFTVSGMTNFVPYPSGTVFAAQNGGVFGPPSYYYRSTDNGLTWQTHWLFEIATGDNWMVVNGKGEWLLTTSEGLMISRNQGKTWETTGFTADARRLLAAPSGRILAVGAGIWESTDGGWNWGLIDTLAFNDLQIAPNGDYFYRRAAAEAFYKASPSNGIYRSDDGASTRSRILATLNPTGLGIAPDGTIWVGAHSAIFRSADNGNSWERFDSGMNGRSIATLARTTNNDLFALAATGLLPDGRRLHNLYRSTDDGATWAALRDSLDGTILQAASDGALYAARGEILETPGVYPPQDSAVVRLLRSVDGGTTWSETEGNGSVMEVATAGETVAAAFTRIDSDSNVIGGDVLFSHDGGRTWRRLTDPGEAWEDIAASKPVAHVAVLKDGSILFGVLGRNGRELRQAGLYRITTGGDVEAVDTGLAATGLGVAPDGSILATASRVARAAEGEPMMTGEYGIYRSVDNGAVWSRVVADEFPSLETEEFALGPDGALFVTLNGTSYRSGNNGASWTEVKYGAQNIRLTSFQFHASGSIFAKGQSITFYSVNAGRTWGPIGTGLHWPGISDHILTGTGTLLGGTPQHGMYRVYRNESGAVEADRKEERTDGRLRVEETGGEEYGLHFTTGSPGSVSVALFDLLGRKVSILIDRSFPAGEHRARFDASDLPRGLYLLVMSGPDGIVSTPVRVR